MNITINSGAALDDASQIDSIVATIQSDMETLNGVFKETIPDKIQTTWSDTVKENWNSYYTADITAAMEEMKLLATNLRLAVEQVQTYNQEQK